MVVGPAARAGNGTATGTTSETGLPIFFPIAGVVGSLARWPPGNLVNLANASSADIHTVPKLLADRAFRQSAHAFVWGKRSATRLQLWLASTGAAVIAES